MTDDSSSIQHQEILLAEEKLRAEIANLENQERYLAARLLSCSTIEEQNRVQEDLSKVIERSSRLRFDARRK